MLDDRKTFPGLPTELQAQMMAAALYGGRHFGAGEKT